MKNFILSFAILISMTISTFAKNKSLEYQMKLTSPTELSNTDITPKPTPMKKDSTNAKENTSRLKITKKTYVSEILKEYGDIAAVMELFGVKRVGAYGFRKIITHVITVKTAAFVHGVPLDKFLGMVQSAVENKKSTI